MATTTDDRGLVHEPGSSSSGSQTPYLRLVKTQLNFFMTRTLFMQQQGADSLGAQKTNALRMQNSASSMNNSGSRVASSSAGAATAQNGDELLGYFDDNHDESDDVWVYADNAKILPNSQAMSMPPIPFPSSGPESPRQVERKDGVRFMTPTHIPTDPLGRKKPAVPDALPVAPMSEMALVDEEEEDDDDVIEEVPMEDAEDAMETMSVGTSSGSDEGGRRRNKSIPRTSQVFPRNQRRSKRLSSRERLPVSRSRSFGRQSDGTRSGDEGESRSLESNSCH